MDYGGLIGDAVRITWRNKYLWLFGVLPSAGLMGGSFSPPSNFRNLDPATEKMLDAALANFERGARSLVSENLFLVVMIGALLLLIYLLFFLTGVLCRGALVESVAATDGGERRDFTSTLRAGRSSFWRVLVQVLLFALIWAGLLFIVGLPMIFLFVKMAGNVRALQAIAFVNAMSLAALLVAILFVPVGIVAQFALRELVVGERGVLASIGGGYRLFRRNPGRSLLVWFIQVVLMVGAGIPIAITTLVMAVALAIPAIVLAIAGHGSAAMAAGAVAALTLLLALALVYAILGTFSSSYWTLAYLRLTDRSRQRAV